MKDLYSQILREVLDSKFKLPGGWKVLPVGSDHKVSTSGQPAGYGVFMTDEKDSFFFDHNPKRDTDEVYPTEQKAYDEFMKEYNTSGTDYNGWKNQQEHK